MPFFVELFCLLRSLCDLARAAIEVYSAHGARGERYAPKHMGKRRGGSARNEKDRL